ncbi:hypothetical protein PENVUL_c009G09164 [Penicillium vulpinum]|uniref:Small ribosomal subunit protein eS1 n=2 Tax=Penicillium vulpinum TaxID=29845 RepID=A0A1V6S3E4_9EURO|nr:hypothetical protein PENVUL_c009G09164 [Penicillium vulpinum]
MAVGKNKRLSKGKKGIKKRTVDPFTRKDEYSVKAPSTFQTRDVGKTLVNRTSGLKNANDSLKGRIFEVSLADLQNDEDHAFRKVKLRVDEIQGKNCLTNFHGLDFTTDKLRSLVRKWQTLIEANITVKTTDDYLLRLFAIAFTKRRPNQIKKTTYAASSQIRAIRKKMVEIIQREASTCTLSQLTHKLIPEVIGREIEKSTQGIYPLQNVHIRKVKLLKSPKFDLGALLALHGESATDDKGQKVELTRSHKSNDREHQAEGVTGTRDNIPRYFAKSGPTDADPRKTKKDGGGKGNWGRSGDEMQDTDYSFANARRHSNSSTQGLADFNTKFEAFEPEPVFEEEDIGDMAVGNGNAVTKVESASSNGSAADRDGRKY